ncbi:hypothetical protein A3C59_02955 [Candidatus Daviesbacteria bacterium RIFCSPHIGHO2_02_FULL_36_13]|uniref:OmpR/PhoB-type domain-containing protein n=1 Tax=Candidatus Daviesbacteria bacterium RIFCSPHIGHO2_02_FULL_36_13 TaxID=1797768 RepID=A0A1F5JUL7_9BACT|nr:MAG: hypothetical protein A3C59_02955 [Candidatus Daviesbacteria bacterium RIFCSPHIGHO2_02_FULL_36_13]
MYNFKEAELGPDFAKEKMTELKAFIDAGLSFTILSMPGVGVSYALKYLASQSYAHFIHIDMYALPSLTQHEFYKETLKAMLERSFLSSSAYRLLLTKSDDELFSEIKKKLVHLAEKQEKIVIIFSRFDQLKKDFDWNFLSNIQSLTTIAPNKIVEIFTSVKPLNETAPEAVSGGNLNFFSKDLYFKPFESSDLKKLFLLEHTLKAHPNLDDLISLSGGHVQLFYIILNSHKQQNLMLDQFVKQQMKFLVGYLDYTQRKQIQKIAKGNPGLDPGSIDEYLLGVGMVTEGHQLFTPLLTQYIRENMPIRLPAKEAKLFKLLKLNMGKTVPKEEIFNEVWGENNDSATDWALDALIYRLRKHPFMLSHGYIIESNKKVGYSLIQT